MNINSQIDQQIENICNDLTFNVTKIYNRNDLLISILLTYFSTSEFFPFDNRDIRGWLDVLIFGESRSGKSEAIRGNNSKSGMLQFFKKGGLNREKATYPGLVGGVGKDQHGYYSKSGLFPANDRGLVIIDEMQNILPDELGRMSDVRSSGVAQITAIRSILCMARCRKIWIANPRPEPGVTSVKFGAGYNHPVTLVKKLIVNDEDMTRFDLMLGFKMSPEEWRHKFRGYEKPEHIFTSNKFKRLLDIAWTRQPSDIKFKPEAVESCYSTSKYLSGEYSSDFPMIIGAEQPDRMARLAVALAGFIKIAEEKTVNELETITVYREHVEWIANWLENLFKTNDLKYAQYAHMYNQKEKQFVHVRDKIVEKIRNIKNYKQLVFACVNSGNINSRQLREEAPDIDNPDKVLSGFYRAGLIKAGRGGMYFKTALFEDILNTEFKEEVCSTNIDDINFGEQDGVGI